MSNSHKNKPTGAKCKGSGKEQMLCWLPEDDGYPGAVVCLYCSRGILVRKGSVRKAVSEAGQEGYSGMVRSHES